MKNIVNMLISGTLGMVAFGLLLFLPAGTFNYWQAWALLVVTGTLSWIFSIYFLLTNPAALRRRMPAIESRSEQKLIVGAIFLLWTTLFVVSALDHRFGWSAVPTAVSLFGDLLVAIGVATTFLVVAQNNHAAVTIRVEEDQELVSTGLYGLVRHPMYACNAFLLVGTPLALGSYWGLLFVIPIFILFGLRIRDEEQLLVDELTGYSEYLQKVRYRLVPGIW